MDADTLASKCVVCGIEGGVPHLGAKSVCKYCFELFKQRAKDDQLLCERSNNQCSISFGRNGRKCRSCFVRKCRRAGMELVEERKAREIEEFKRQKSQGCNSIALRYVRMRENENF